MRSIRAWAEEYWDVLAIALGLASAVVLGGALGVVYNVAMLRSTPVPIGAGTAPAPPPPAELLRAAPFS